MLQHKTQEMLEDEELWGKNGGARYTRIRTWLQSLKINKINHVWRSLHVRLQFIIAIALFELLFITIINSWLCCIFMIQVFFAESFSATKKKRGKCITISSKEIFSTIVETLHNEATKKKWSNSKPPRTSSFIYCDFICKFNSFMHASNLAHA